MFLEKQRHVVGRADIVHTNHLLWLNLTEHSDLIGGGLVKGSFATACNKIWA